MSNNYKKVCTTLNYVEHFLILVSVVTGCISVSAFASLLDIPTWITSFAIRFRICGITSAIKKKKKMKHDKIVLLAKTKWNRRKALIDS